MDHKITFVDAPSNAELQTIRDRYQAFTEARIGKEDRKEIALFIRDDKDSVIGGVRGGYGNYGWLWIDLLWVPKELRGMGYGLLLMTKIEQEAKAHGCTHAYLNSFSFQGVEFYKKIGYTVFGEMKDFPIGHSVYSLSKKLHSRIDY